GAVRRNLLRPGERRAEKRRLRHLPDRRSLLPALGNHRGAGGTGGLLSPFRPLSDGGAHLYRRLYGAVLGEQGRGPAGNNERHPEGRQGLQEGKAENGLLQPGRPRRRLRPAGMDQEIVALEGNPWGSGVGPAARSSLKTVHWTALLAFGQTFLTARGV